MIPLALIAARSRRLGVDARRPRPTPITAMRILMVLFVAAGFLGIALHYLGNREFQREMDPALAGWPLFVEDRHRQSAAGARARVDGHDGPARPDLHVSTSGACVVCTPFAILSQEHSDHEDEASDRRGPAGRRRHGRSRSAQVGKSLGVVDANTAPEKDLLAMPHMTPAIVKGLIEKRPFASITDLNAYLLSQKLTQDQANAFYGKAFVHINLNTATAAEILLVPGAGKRMAHEFDEYRPWKTYAQFDKEIGKYVGADQTARLAQYTFIPVKLNTATDADILSIPGAGQRMVREFKEYRPWKTKEQFIKEIGKYVGAKEAERMWRYVVID